MYFIKILKERFWARDDCGCAIYMSTDVDECVTSNGGCAHSCTNTVPGFACGCRDGFLLSSDGFSCDGGCNAPLYCMPSVSLQL